MKRLITIILILIAQQANSQKFTNADIAGKYNIVKIYVDDTLVVDYSSETAFTAIYLKQLAEFKRKNPTDMSVDSLSTIADAKDAFLRGKQLEIAFEGSGHVVMSNPMGGGDTTATWKFDADMQRIEFTESVEHGQYITPQWVGKKPGMTIIGNNDPRNRVMLVKE
jgi:hypothetical protein